MINRFTKPAFFLSATFLLSGLAVSTRASNAPTLQSPSTSLTTRSQLISQSFKPPRRGTAPPSAGGATRGETCLKGSKQLTSLMPQARIGLTYSSNPTFYWFVPPSPATAAKFLLLSNDDATVVYETTLSLPSQPGVISFTLPSTTGLEVGKQYHWYLVVRCGETDQGANPSVEGWVERITPESEVSIQLEKATPAERAKLYADNGIWYEAVTTLAELRRTRPDDTIAIAGWTELLKSVGLDAIAAEPLSDRNLSQN